MNYRIPEELINRYDVNIFVDKQTHTVHIKSSKKFEDELKRWPADKVSNILDDIQKDLEYTVLFKPIYPGILDDVYDRVFATLRKEY